MATPRSKTSFREEWLEKRAAMAPSEVERLSDSVARTFLGLTEYAAAKRLALYSSFGNEVRTDGILDASLKDGKEVFYPKSDALRSELSFFKVVNGSELVPGLFEIKEPSGKAPEDNGKVESFDLIVVPGVCFDMEGGRIGFGKGFYDRVLGRRNSPVLALAYDFQITEERLPAEPHDEPVDAVITESRVISF